MSWVVGFHKGVIDMSLSEAPTFHYFPYLGDAWKALVDAAGAVLLDNDKETLNSLTKFVDQLPSVLNEVL